MRFVYVIGGQQRAPRAALDDDPNWYSYQRGLILRVDLDTGDADICAEYQSPPEACASGDPVLFKSGTAVGDRLFVCTQTEILVYTIPEFERIGYVSLPCFNDVHHVYPTPRHTLLVANSGLEMVLEVTLDGEIRREWNVLGEDPWAGFSRAIDYRKGVSTKPHRAHPNFVTMIGDDIWVTRFEKRDALCLTDRRRIDIGIERVHDGIVHHGRMYFTTVNGHIVIANPDTQCVERVIDLTGMAEQHTLVGWCRSLMLDEERVWVGFSRIRPTRFRETLSWIRTGFSKSLPTHIACFDLHRRRQLALIDLEQHGLNAVFGIYPETQPDSSSWNPSMRITETHDVADLAASK
jgi:hypothetical protein